MVRIQMQLPDNVFAKATRLCEARQISFDELARRGIESMFDIYAKERGNADGWQPPEPRNLGWKGLSHEEIKTQAQLHTSEVLAIKTTV